MSERVVGIAKDVLSYAKSGEEPKYKESIVVLADGVIELWNRAKELETKLNLLVDSINLQRLECQQGKNLNETNYRLWEAVKPMLQEGVRRMRGKKMEVSDESEK